MTPRRWENLAKYFYDLSKLTLSIAVVTQYVARGLAEWKILALGGLTGVSLFAAGWIADMKGETDE